MRNPLSPEEARWQFEQLLASAAQGNPPSSDTGLPGEVEEALLNIVLGAGTADDARIVFDDLYQ